ncbi:MAG TPA: hypothetical protein ENK05_10620 [Gammaproteobacteria bacterium]|nr:hypothetical protein [Gammaproteobacteria bacterium]
MKTISRTRRNLYAVTLGLLVGTPASAITISDTPLFVTAAVDPNVMLLIDTSGSMDNIVTAPGYDNKVIYPDWSRNNSYWYKTSGNVRYSTLGRNGCPSGWKGGRNSSGTNKCLRLPNPSDDGDTRFSGNYLNYLFETYPNNSDLRGVIPNETRMQVARQAAKDLIDQTTGVRFGSASFNYKQGGTVDAGCGTAPATVKATIDGYRGDSWTPLSEALYEVTRYFRGMSSYYNGGSYTSPIQYRCQHNFAVVITDGLPTYDTSFPSNDPADTADSSAALPNWDNEAPPTAQSDYPNFPQYSDGFQPSGSQSNEGYSLYLDDIAKFAFDTDFKPSGTDDAGGSYQDPDFPVQNMETYTIGFAQSNQMLEDAADYGNGLYFTADDAASLSAALKQAIADAKFKGEAAAAAVATNSTRLDTNTTIYQARFDSRDWSGDLLAFGIDDATGEVLVTPQWSARDRLPPSTSATVTASSRHIYTYDTVNNTGIEFLWPSDYTSLTAGVDLNSGMVQSLLANAPYSATTTNSSEIAANQAYGSELVAYLRGDTSSSGSYNGAFRSRNSVLGDIVNSNPAFVGTRDFGYKVLPDPEGADYLTFRSSSSYKNRIPMLYVGANDGMLHAFNADTGNELFAFVPSVVFPNLDQLADPNYAHRFFVNGSPRVGDAYLGGSWKSVLVGSTGAGGREVFALDITSPGSFDASNLMWEFTGDDDGDLGYVLGQPTIARMPDGNWVAVVGNGYKSDNQHAVLFLLSLYDGTVLQKIDTQVGSAANPNGLAAPVPVDTDGDRITDTIYAGDLQGNLWKFTVNASNTWKVAYKSGSTPKPLYTALDSNGDPQPITLRPEIGSHPRGGLMVYFGTGSFFQSGDNIVGSNPPVNTFYGLRDNGSPITGGRSALQRQTIDYELYNVGFGSNTFDVRIVSDNVVNYQTSEGWFIDLESPVNGAEGERVVVDPLLRNGRIIFSTLIPNVDPCGWGGKGWLMEMQAISGGRFNFSVFDLNGDGEFTAADFANANGNDFSVSGRRFNEIISQPVVIDAGEKEHKYVSGSSGGIGHITEKGDGTKGRQSWRQIR